MGGSLRGDRKELRRALGFWEFDRLSGVEDLVGDGQVFKCSFVDAS